MARAEGLANANTLAGSSQVDVAQESALPPFSERSGDKHVDAVEVLAAKHGLSDVICQHALQSFESEYDELVT